MEITQVNTGPCEMHLSKVMHYKLSMKIASCRFENLHQRFVIIVQVTKNNLKQAIVIGSQNLLFIL